MTETAARRPNSIRLLGWGTLAVLLSLPAILRFPWTLSDFVIMGLMLGSVGLGIEWLVRRSGSAWYRLGAVVAVLTFFLTIWANLAVGMIGSEDNPYNLRFMAVPIVAFVAATAFRFKAWPTALIMGAAAAAQLVLALGGIEVDARGARFSAIFTLLWMFSAALFAAAARR